MGQNTTIFIYLNIYQTSMRRIQLLDKNLNIKDEIEVLFEKKVTKFGSGAKIDCPKEYLNKKVYILVRK